jgi:CheY-like chemotaxis protein
MQKMLNRLIGEDIELMVNFAPDLARARVDYGHIEQVLMNLVVNARDAMKGGGMLWITTQNAHIDSNFVREHLEAREGDYAMISIKDTGCGMTPETLVKIFEPFFTTKEVGKGTGLGLSTVYGIVKQHDGYITVDSQVGVGTTFNIYLPVAEGEVSEISTREVSETELRGKESILVVEDDDGLRDLVVRVLRRYGYNAIEAQSGGDAYLISKRLDRPVDLLLTDVIMPAMSGVQLVEELNKFWPGLKVLYMSGYTNDRLGDVNIDEVREKLITKPFHPYDLVKRIRSMLDKNPE